MRNQPRYSIKSKTYLKAYDCETGFLLGYVLDLSEGGLRIVSDESMVKGKELQIRIHNRISATDILKFKLSVCCQWCCHDLNYDHYEIGLRVLEPCNEFNHIVAKLRLAREKEAL